MKDNGIYIAAAKRSPIGKLNGVFASLSAAEIGSQVIEGMLAEHDFDHQLIDEVIIGQVLTGGAGQNPARQSAVWAGLPSRIPAMTVNMVCGAGQKSIHLAAQAIKAGDADLVLAGGQDSMTQAPHVLHARAPKKLGDQVMKDSMITDGLWDKFYNIHMGETVEPIASRYDISREMQDEFALNSQLKTKRAMESCLFEQEIVPIKVKTNKSDAIVSHDEQPRPQSSLKKLSEMPPAFVGQGTITAGNASGINDGAATVLVGRGSALASAGLKPMVRIVSYASAALDPIDMGLGPVLASKQALSKAGWTVDQLDVVELNEAFAAQSIAVMRDLSLNPEKVNPNGGAIALGHPLAASGCRIVVSLIHQMIRANAKRGLASMCIGGGQGVSICLELVD